MDHEKLVTLIPRERSPMAAVCGAIAAMATGALAVAFGLDEGLSTGARGTALGAGALVTASLAAGSIRLWRPRGGVFWASGPRALGIGFTRGDDVLWIPEEEIVGLTTTCLQASDEEEPLWSLLVSWRGHADWLLLEGPDRDALQSAMAEFRERTGLPEAPETDTVAPPPSPPESRRITFAVRTGVALQGLLVLFGLALLLIGLLLVPQYRAQPIFAIFFGPVLVLLGGTLLALDLIKRLALERLEHEAGLWTHGFQLGTRRWGDRTVSAPHPRWVMRPLGLKGAHLEVIGPREMLVIGSGATTFSRTDVATLCRIPSQFRADATSGPV